MATNAWPLLATLLLGAAGAAAQPVTLYGIVDTGIEHLNHVGAAGASLTRVPSLTGSVPSRVGLRGGDDLGGGLRAVFTLESGFAPDAGTLAQGGRLFGRQAWVGLAGTWGTLSFGRQYSMLFWSLLEADILGPNIYSSGSLDSAIPNARVDNAVAYRGTFGALMVGATYSLGRDTVNAGPSPAGTNCPGESSTDSRACRQWSALAKYDRPAWGAALAIDEQRGGPGAFGGLVSSALTDRRVSANGYAKRGAHKVALGLVRRDNQGNVATPRSDLWYVGASSALSPRVTLEGQVFRLSFDGSNDAATLLAARGFYHFSPRTATYLTAGSIDNDGNLALSASAGGPGGDPVAGAAQLGVMVGLRHVF